MSHPIPSLRHTLSVREIFPPFSRLCQPKDQLHSINSEMSPAFYTRVWLCELPLGYQGLPTAKHNSHHVIFTPNALFQVT